MQIVATAERNNLGRFETTNFGGPPPTRERRDRAQSKEENSMRELTTAEMQLVAGGDYPVLDTYIDIKEIVIDLPDLYDAAIDSLATMMCRFTEACD